MIFILYEYFENYVNIFLDQYMNILYYSKKNEIENSDEELGILSENGSYCICVEESKSKDL